MSSTPDWLRRGLWTENPVLVHLLGLCPLLAVTNTVVNALLLGAATLVVLIATNCVVSLLRSALVSSVRIPLFVLIIASFVTSVDLLIDAWFHDLHVLIGLFIPLIVTNCTILAQAETVASRNSIGAAFASAIGTGAGFLGALLALGAIRELLGRGTLFSGFDMLPTLGFGESGQEKRQFHVLESRQNWNQVVHLEDETYVPCSPGGEISARHVGYFITVDRHRS